MKRYRRVIVIAAIVFMALVVPSLLLSAKLKAMRHEVEDWKAAQVALVELRPTAAEVLRRAESGGFRGWLVKEDDGTVIAVHIAGPQWHYAWFDLESGRAVGVSFSVK